MISILPIIKGTYIAILIYFFEVAVREKVGDVARELARTSAVSIIT